MGLRIYVTGRVAIEVDGRVVVDERQFRGKQGRLLFVYLVSERSRSVAKEELASVLWPEEQSEAWEAALSARPAGWPRSSPQMNWQTKECRSHGNSANTNSSCPLTPGSTSKRGLRLWTVLRPPSEPVKLGKLWARLP